MPVLSLEDLVRITRSEEESLTEILYYSLETLCICFPARISGSEVLERSLTYLFEYGQRDIPHDCCVEEIVGNMPQWVRKKTVDQLKLIQLAESAEDAEPENELLTVDITPSASAWPSPYPLRRTYCVVANGLSVGTTSEGLRSEIVIIKSWEELTLLGEEGLLNGKMVLYNFVNFTSYGDVAAFRRFGGDRAQKYGASAVLIRSLTPNCSVSGLHTGSQEPNIAIPCACVTIEDAEVLTRLAARGHGLQGRLQLPCHFVSEPKKSRNLIFDIKGSEFPDEIVLLGGHTDCWDCQHDGCQGAHDDGQGVIVSLEIIRYLYRHNYRPRRTIRAVLFVDEEVAQSGAIAYQQDHQGEASKVQVAIETDLGVGPVCGFGFTGSSAARSLLQHLLAPLATSLNQTLEVRDSWSGTGVDISPMLEIDGVPGMLLRHEDTWWQETYFHFHHTNADTIDHVDKKLLFTNFQVLLGAVWVLANCDERLPHVTPVVKSSP